MKLTLKYFISTAVDLPIEAGSVEEALRAAQEEGTLARVFGLTALGRDDVVDMQVSGDCENGTPAVDEYYDVEAFT